MKSYYLKNYLKNNFQLKKIVILVTIDFFCIVASFFLAFFFRYENLTSVFEIDKWSLVITISITYIFIKIFSKKYEITLRGFNFYLHFIFSFLSALFFFSLIYFFFDRASVARSIPIIFLLINIFLLSAVYSILDYLNKKLTLGALNEILIFGYNDVSKNLVYLLSSDSKNRLNSIVDENYILKSLNYFANVPLIDIDDLQKIKRLIINNNINKIYVCREFKKDKIEKIYSFIKNIDQNVELIKTTNNNSFISNLIFSNNKFLSDLVGTKNDIKYSREINNFYKNKKILITGAAGTIGSALYEALKKFKVNNIFLLDNSELNIYNLINKHDLFNSRDSKIYLGTINDLALLKKIFQENDIDVVFHAAAYKHVSIVEENFLSSINNNIFGTEKLISSCIKYKVKNFVQISTDKAVEPYNLMGTTKRIAEKLVKYYSNDMNVKNYTSVRFGNVAGSSGSVIPRFIEDIQTKKEITVTHKSVERYFMSAEEAAYLVVLSPLVSSNGDILYLDMGKPIKILNIAKKLKKIMKNVGLDISIKISNLAKGEKLKEELHYKKIEKVKKSKYEKIFITEDTTFNRNKFFKDFNLFKKRYNKNRNNLNYDKNNFKELNKKLNDLAKS